MTDSSTSSSKSDFSGMDRNEQNLIEGQETPQRFSPLCRQIITAGAPILATVAAGFTTGYSAIFLPQLQLNTSTIQIDDEQASWIASLAAFGMAPGCLIGGYIMQRYGRKFAHYFLCIPTILGWLAILTAENVFMILIGRFLTGLSTGLLGGPASVYIAEISEPKYRGFLLASITLSISFGILLCHVLGTFYSWKIVALIASIFPVFIFLILAFVPESPSWLMTKHRIEDAKISFRWLRGYSSEATSELKSLLKKHDAQKKEEIASNIKGDSIKMLKMNMKKREFLKPFAIILFFFFTMQFSGVNSVAFYTVSLMKNITGPGYEYLSMIVIDTVRVFMSFIACILLRLCYRRTLVIFSGIGTSLCMISVAVFMYLYKIHPENFAFSLCSMGFLIGYICFISIGIFPLPWVLQGEMLQQVTRGLSSGLTSSFNFICFFIVVKTFMQMSEALDTYGVFLIYGIVAFVGTLILYAILPETRNKTLQEIEDNFSRQ